MLYRKAPGSRVLRDLRVIRESFFGLNTEELARLKRHQNLCVSTPSTDNLGHSFRLILITRQENHRPRWFRMHVAGYVPGTLSCRDNRDSERACLTPILRNEGLQS